MEREMCDFISRGRRRARKKGGKAPCKQTFIRKQKKKKKKDLRMKLGHFA